jgi:hypothetical protein
MRPIHALVVVAAFSWSWACSAGREVDPPASEQGDGGLLDAPGVDDGGFNADVPLDAELEGAACGSDMQTVVDASGHAIGKCPPELGCLEGKCVEACVAAAGIKGSVGCDFVVSTPSFYPDILPPCFAVFLANNWPKDVQITVTRAGSTLDVGAFGRIPTTDPNEKSWPTIAIAGVPPGKVGVLFMSSDPASVNKDIELFCRVPQAIAGHSAVLRSGQGTAFHIKTSFPVSAYDILPYGGARSLLPSAQLILPTTAWGTNYVAVVPVNEAPFAKIGAAGLPTGPQWGQIVAAQDDTHVKIVPTIDLPAAGSAPAIAKGTVGTVTLDADRYLQWQPSGNMSGSVIQSDKPIAFVGGSALLCLQSATSPTGGGCDCGHQQNLPVAALGSAYVAAPYATRQADMSPESIPYRLVGAVDGTVLTYDPPVAGAPSAIDLGRMVDFQTNEAFTVSSQDDAHPFVLTQMMSGSQTSSGSRPGAIPGPYGDRLGDEEYVNVLPPKQFLAKYVFFTDPTYPTTNLVVTRVKGSTGFKDVKIDCLGTISGFRPVGTAGQYEIADVDLIRAGAKVGDCDNGLHVATSDGGFGLTVWGLDSYASYAYPAGGNVGTINDVVVPPVPR